MQVTNNLLSETVRNLTEAANLFPSFRNGRPVHPATLTRWILKGVRGPNGACVRLEALKRPAGWITSVEAVERFLAALTPNLNASRAPTPATPGKRRRASERAAKELEKLGI
jgi:hypothetical protein